MLAPAVHPRTVEVHEYRPAPAIKQLITAAITAYNCLTVYCQNQIILSFAIRRVPNGGGH